MDSPATIIRPLRSEADFRACVALQRLTWGEHFEDLVPPSILAVAQKIGGVAAGAFDERGTLLGFVFGMAGVRDGRVVHWSDMLAVRPEARDRGVGRALKEFQRAAAIASGATTMYWTFDPLIARNAHLNFNRLHVRVDEYVEDMYGASTSDLHRGLGTDRLVVAWELLEGPGAGAEEMRDVPSTPVLAPRPSAPAPVLEPDASGTARPAALSIEIPDDILRLRDASPREAAEWRARTRRAFQWALANGYVVVRFIPGAPRGAYLLERAGDAP